MAAGATLQVEGLQNTMRAFAKADKDTRKAMRETLKKVGEKVQLDASRSLAGKDSRSAAGYRTVVRQRGVAVEQRLKKTTGAHPEWGAYQMRHALVPALYANEADTERRMEHAMEQVCDHFNRGGAL